MVSANGWFEGSIPFGKAQMLELWDYADGFDTMKFWELSIYKKSEIHNSIKDDNHNQSKFKSKFIERSSRVAGQSLLPHRKLKSKTNRKLLVRTHIIGVVEVVEHFGVAPDLFVHREVFLDAHK
jgi:hypothetical protein